METEKVMNIADSTLALSIGAPLYLAIALAIMLAYSVAVVLGTISNHTVVKRHVIVRNAIDKVGQALMPRFDLFDLWR